MAFDINSFTNATYADAFATKRELIPVGEYRASIIGMPDFSLHSPGRVMAKLKLKIHDDTEDLKDFGPEVFMYHTMFLDVDENDPTILLFGTNKNIALGQLRDALGQNEPGHGWNPGMLADSGLIKIKVDHRAEKKEGQATGNIFDGVTRFARCDD